MMSTNRHGRWDPFVHIPSNLMAFDIPPIVQALDLSCLVFLAIAAVFFSDVVHEPYDGN